MGEPLLNVENVEFSGDSLFITTEAQRHGGALEFATGF
jgi:hypothetical protein